MVRANSTQSHTPPPEGSEEPAEADNGLDLDLGPTRCDDSTVRSVEKLLNQRSESSGHIYSILPAKRTFRLLCLFRSESPNHPLKGVLIDQVIDDSLPYDCLSYTWGSPGGNTSIELQGNVLAITKNLDVALRNIRSRIHPSAEFTLIWVDAICINQQDYLERNNQVGQMRQIYTHAERVIAYLGEDADDSQHLASLFPTILGLWDRKSSPPPDTDFSIWNFIIKEEEYENFGLPPANHTIWRAYAKFLNRPWFVRAWIVQEALLARHLVFICGSWSLPGFVLAHIVQSAARHLVAVSNSADTTDRNAIHHFILTLLIRPSEQEAMHSISLLDLLDMVGRVVATDPRDYLYAFVGISEEEQEQELSPRYDLPVSETYKQFARFAVSHGDGIKLLYAACKCDSGEHMPSWVPNLAGRKETSSMFFPDFGPASGLLTSYACAGGSSRNIDLGEFDTLLVQGYRVGIITRVVHHPSPQEHSRKGMIGGPYLQITEWLKSILDLLPIPRRRPKYSPRYSISSRFIETIANLLEEIGPYPSGESTEEVLWRTALKNQQKGLESEATEEEHQSFISFCFMNAFLSATRNKRKLMIDEAVKRLTSQIVLDRSGEPISESDMFSIFLEHTTTMAERFMDDVMMAVGDGRLFTTTAGYIGQAPHEAQEGDIVVVFNGAPTPFIMRPLGTSLRLICPCYVHGLMKGEALNSQSFKAEVIKIV